MRMAFNETKSQRNQKKLWIWGNLILIFPGMGVMWIEALGLNDIVEEKMV